MRWPSVRGAARVLALAAGLLALALPLTTLAGQGGASPYQWTTSVAGSSQLHGVVWDGSQFVAFGDGGAVYTSPDGQKWTAAQSGTDKALQAAAWSGQNLVAVGSEGLLLQSPDAKAWSVKAHGLPAAATAVAYGQIKAGKGLFVAVGPQGLLFTSHDGSAWKSRTSGTTQNLNAVAYGDGLFVAVGDAGAILSSADGKKWSPASGATVNLQGVAFGNGLYVAVGQNGALFTSADARTWTAAQDPQSEALNAVAFTGMGFVAVGQGGTIVASADGRSWTIAQSPTSAWLHGVTYGQGHVVAVGDSGMVALAVTPYYIGGVVTAFNAAGQPVSGVTLSAVGAINPGPYTATTNATGSYQINNLPNNDTYTVTPTGGAGWTFAPVSASVAIAGAPATQNFVVSTYNITARVTNNLSVNSITPTITATGGGNTFTVTAGSALTAGNSANYIVHVPPGIYTVTASGAPTDHAMFTPVSETADASAGAVNLTATPFTAVDASLQAGHVYSGVSPDTSTPLPGVAVTATNGVVTYSTLTDSAGAFQFYLTNGAWTLHFVKGGYSFSPNNGTPGYYDLTVAGDVTTYAWWGLQVFSIGGHVTLNGVGNLPGATLTLSGAATGTATSNASGVYSFTLLPAGTYTVTPSWTGPGTYTFTPPSTTLIIGPSSNAVNFDATPPSYTFAGHVYQGANPSVTPLPGVVVTATLLPSGPTYNFTSLADGSFTFTLPGTGPGQQYSFTCAKAGYTFQDGGAVPLPYVTALTSNITGAGFYGIQSFSIQGVVTVGGVGIAGVLIDDGGGHTAHTNASGIYNLTGLPAGAYTLTAALTGYSFSPAPGVTFPVSVGPNATNINFVGVTTYSISGTVWNASSLPPNQPLPNVSITIGGALPPGYTPVTILTAADGTYSFPNLPAGSYTLTLNTTVSTPLPARKFIYDPASPAAVVIVAADKTQNFTATQVFTISGSVKDSTPAGVVGVTITANDGLGHVYSAVTAGVNGTYTLQNVVPGSYTLTPTAPAGTVYDFSPTTLTPTVSTANVPNQNFLATRRWAISGYVYQNGTTTGIPGVDLSVTDGVTTYTGTTAADGSFSFNLASGSWTWTETKTNYIFADGASTPPPQTYAVSGDSSGYFFFGYEAYSISGTVHLGAGFLAGVTVTTAPLGLTATTDASGNYTILNVPVSATAYTITPSLAGYGFTPATQSALVPTGGPGPTGVDFTAFLVYNITGTITPDVSATVTPPQLVGTTVTAVSGANTYTGHVLDNTGAYTIAGVPAGSYTVTPSQPGVGFSPANRPVSIVSADATGADFEAFEAYHIKGTVTIGLVGLPGVTVAAGAGLSAVTDATGAFDIPNVKPSATPYTVTPTLAGYVFTPVTRSETVTAADVTGVTFTAAHVYSISGKVTSGASGLAGVTISAGGSFTATTAADGTYTISNLPAATYTVTPSKTGYTFSPTSLSETITSANITGVNFTATAIYTISGTVKDLVGNAVSGVTVSAGAGLTATTAGNGTYTINNVPPGNYTLTPSLSTYTFSPATRAVSIVSTNVTGADFTITYFTVSASGTPTSGDIPLTVNFTSSTTGGQSPYTYDWNFGDGSAHGTGMSPSHQYTAVGVYTVQLIVTDANGKKGYATPFTVTAGTVPLAVTATGTPTTGGTPLSVSFSATATGGVAPYTYAWSFGDGGTGTGATPSHTYTTANTFTAVVVVTDSASNTANDTVTIKTLNPPVISAVTKMQNPFRLKVMGSNFHPSAIVKINGVMVPFSNWKSSGLIVAKKGSALSAMVPKGVPVQITVTNTDDGGVSTPYTFVR